MSLGKYIATKIMGFSEPQKPLEVLKGRLFNDKGKSVGSLSIISTPEGYEYVPIGIDSSKYPSLGDLHLIIDSFNNPTAKMSTKYVFKSTGMHWNRNSADIRNEFKKSNSKWVEIPEKVKPSKRFK